MLRIIRILIFLGFLTTGFLGIGACENTITIDVLSVEGGITPDIADYIKSGIEHAEESKAIACIIELDTSGGSDAAMHDIVHDIVNARVPVVAYVSPAGARAAAAGVFITMAAHIAAMAPNTVIGSASFVSVVTEGDQRILETMQEKIRNDAAAYIMSIAELHGRNTEWAEQSVKIAISANELEALELKVIDIVASDLNSLISQLDGRKVTLLNNRVITLDTQGATINLVNNR